MTAFLAFCLWMPFANAQNGQVKGVVTDKTNQGAVGVSVLVQGTTIGTLTDADGSYILNNVPMDGTLEFSCIGMVTQTVPIANRGVINVQMQEDVEMLEETVVIGYGTVKKADLTGAVSVVKPEEYREKTNTSIGDMLQGAAAGVSVRSSGEIGSVPTIQIRGTSNLTNNDPLYVIDGMPTSNDINFNVNDIESIQVLKDASAAAIYGSRAANGVVIITTKSGKDGQTKFEFNSQVAIQNLPRVDYGDAEEFKKIYDVAYDNAIADGVPGVNSRMDHWDNDTDWQDAYFKTGVMQNYDLSYSGGTKTGSYRASFNYMGNNGTTIGRQLDRYTVRFNSTGKVGPVTIGENFSVGTTNMTTHGGSILAVVRIPPTIPIYDDSDAATTNGYGRGNLLHARFLGDNPIALAHNGENKNENMFARGTAFAEAKILPWLTYKLNLGVDMSSSTNNSWSTGYACALNGADSPSSASASFGKRQTYLVENTLSFNKDLSRHHLDGVVGTTYQYSKMTNGSGSKKNLITTSGGEFLTQVSTGTSDADASGSLYEAALISYLGRVNYSFADKYLLTLTGRADGSSRFGPGHKWGFFPSVSAAWRVSKENFFNVDWVNDLKVRANWGNLGSQNVGYYDWQMFINSYPQYLYSGDNNGITYGQIMMKLANEDLSWERLEQTNIGIDAAFLDNRLQASLEYYISKSHDVLTGLDLLMTTGNAGGNPMVNAATIENKGVELTLSWKDQVNDDFSYSVSANLSHTANKLTGFGYGKTEQYTDHSVTRVGEPIGLFYVIKTDGIFQSEQEVLDHKNSAGKVIQPDAKPGDMRYIDYNDDGIISTDDRQVLKDKSPWPKLEAGLNLSATYKNWDFGLIGYGKFGCYAYSLMDWYLCGLQDCNNVFAGYDYWTPTNTGSKNPRPLYGDQRNSYTYNDRWIENSSFFRISSISVSYNWKPSFLSKWVDNIKLSVAGQNLVTFTGYKGGYDPDFQASLFEPGQDNCSYPSPRSVIFTVNVRF